MKADYPKLSNKAKTVRWIIVGLLICSAALDFITFAIHPEFWDFEMSPLVMFTKNIFIIFLVKFFVIFLLSYLLITKRPLSEYLRFLYIMMAIYLILFQVIGSISNRQVAKSEPTPEQAPSTEVKLETNNKIAMLYAYYPMAFAMLCFALFNRGWRNE